MINPPPREDMSYLQKVGRVLLFTATLVLICILSSMLAAVGIFCIQLAHHILTGSEVLISDLVIIFISMVVNAFCVVILIKVKHADQKLIPPEEALEKQAPLPAQPVTPRD
jgi:hypothetical protein